MSFSASFLFGFKGGMLDLIVYIPYLFTFQSLRLFLHAYMEPIRPEKRKRR